MRCLKFDSNPTFFLMCVCRCGRFTLRREHNSKLIVTIPPGSQIESCNDGKIPFKNIVLHMMVINVPTATVSLRGQSNSQRRA